jgi:TfoX/Sxy family transcriptional regulator of competence genes
VAVHRYILLLHEKSIMPYDERLAQRIRKALTPYHQHLVEKKMMGGLCFMYKGRMSCGVEQERLIVRVVDSKYRESLKQPHCREMDFTGKVLRAFLYVEKEGIQTDEQLCSWLALGIEFVEQQGPRKKNT